MTSALPSAPAALESPEHVRISLAAAMTLGLKRGRFWRGAKLTCINLLLTYQDGCKANCAYCGLAREREGGGSFIRVHWPVHPLEEIVGRMKTCPDAHRVCISMVTHRRAVDDTLAIAEAIRKAMPIPISGLIAPTLARKADLEAMKAAGIDKIGIAFDTATAEIFDELRGRRAGGPHRWERYWDCFAEAAEVFGSGNVGSHFIVGLGETEEAMVRAFQRVRGLGGVNHLFSHYPEAGARLETFAPPPMEQCRRIQLAAEIIDQGLAGAEDFRFDPRTGKIVDFGIPAAQLDRLIEEGKAFMTRGCVGPDGRVACNRPFANSAPGPGLRNYPFQPTQEDLALIRRQLAGDWIEPLPAIPAGRSPKGVRRNPRKLGRVYFFAPSIKHFETDEFANSAAPIFAPVSITGQSCDLGCKHCRGKLLNGMYVARSPEALRPLASRLKSRGCRGLLLTGGCDGDGLVPLSPFCGALGQIKRELGFKTAVHTKLLDEALAEALAGAAPDVVMLDVAGADETLREMFNLPHKTVADVERGLDLCDRYELALAPHIVLGAHGGRLYGEYKALDMLRGRKLAALVIALLMPLEGKRTADFTPPDLEATREFFRAARGRFPDIPVLLGCARPMGPIQREIDLAALAAGFDGIAYPAEGTVAKARQMSLRPVFSEYCCALMI